MTPEAQRIAIAEACGYKGCTYANCAYRKAEHLHDANGSVCFPEPYSLRRYPDYLNDLNAMHEAEQILTSSAQWTAYNAKLFSVAAGINLAAGVNRPESLWLFQHAKATQRAEAFLRTIGKWEAACKPKDK